MNQVVLSDRCGGREQMDGGYSYLISGVLFSRTFPLYVRLHSTPSLRCKRHATKE